ncbi:hypothetical protein MaudCBS49596_006921 [Microsporum audouinii]
MNCSNSGYNGMHTKSQWLDHPCQDVVRAAWAAALEAENIYITSQTKNLQPKVHNAPPSDSSFVRCYAELLTPTHQPVNSGKVTASACLRNKQMSTNNGADRANDARDSYGSLLDYYFERPASKELIRIGLRAGEVPSQAQAEDLQRELAAALQARDIIDNLTAEERASMENVAFISQSRRARRQLNP